MTPLRQRLIDELDLRGYAVKTRDNYVSAVIRLAGHWRKPPDQLTDDEIKQYLLHLIRVRKLARPTVNVAVSALRFFYQHVLGRSLSVIEDALPRMRSSIKRPQVYSIDEIERLFSAPGLNPKHRVLLMTAYAAGLRVSEVCRLRAEDILSQRMQIRVVQSKGRKDRYTVLSHRLLAELRAYWLTFRPKGCLFPSPSTEQPVTTRTAERVFRKAVKHACLPDRGGIHCLRHSFATHMLENGVDLVVLQRLLGHRSLSATSIYLHVSQMRLQNVCSPLDLVDVTQLKTQA